MKYIIGISGSAPLGGESRELVLRPEPISPMCKDVFDIIRLVISLLVSIEIVTIGMDLWYVNYIKDIESILYVH